MSYLSIKLTSASGAVIPASLKVSTVFVSRREGCSARCGFDDRLLFPPPLPWPRVPSALGYKEPTIAWSISHPCPHPTADRAGAPRLAAQLGFAPSRLRPRALLCGLPGPGCFLTSVHTFAGGGLVFRSLVCWDTEG